MACEHLRARLFELAGGVGQNDAFAPPPRAHFGGCGNFYRVGNRPHNTRHFGNVAQKRGARARVDRVRSGTAEIDVDKIWREFFGDELCGVRHFGGVAAEELDSDGAARGVEGELFENSRRAV